MVLISENWADALDPIVRYRFELGFSRRPSLINTLFNVQRSQRSYEQASGIGAMGIDAWGQWEQSGTVGQAGFDQGYKTTFTHKEYPLEHKISRKLLDDSMWNEINSGATKLGDSAALKREVDAASVFINAFTDTFAGADAVGLVSTAHPLNPVKTGTTQSNEFTLSLTKDNVATIREAMMALTDDNGNLVAVNPNAILVPPELEDEALVISKSMLDPTTDSNAVNPQNGRFNIIVWHYLTDSNAWFMLDTNLMKDNLLWFDRVPLSITPKVEDKTLVATWIAYMRYSYGWSDWKWVAGSNPS